MVKPLNPEDHIVESPLVGCPVAAVALCHLRSTLCQFFGIQHGTCESMLQRRNWHSAWAISLGVSCLMGDPQSSPWFFQYRILNDLTVGWFPPEIHGKTICQPRPTKHSQSLFFLHHNGESPISDNSWCQNEHIQEKIFKIVQTDGIINHMMNKTALNQRGPKGEQLIKRLSLLIQILAGIVQLVPKTTWEARAANEFFIGLTVSSILLDKISFILILQIRLKVVRNGIKFSNHTQMRRVGTTW